MKSNQEVSEYWRQHVRSFESSGMSRKQYCNHKQIKGHQLDYWRKKFRESTPVAQAPTEAWIPVRIHDEQDIERPCGIAVRIGRLEIEVRPGFDRQLLADLIRVVVPVC